MEAKKCGTCGGACVPCVAGERCSSRLHFCSEACRAAVYECRFNPRSLAAREAGCPLDHCACGTHDAMNDHHVCAEPAADVSDEIARAEAAAGWDPNP